MTVLTACRCLRGIPDAQTERVLVPLVERQVFVTEPAGLPVPEIRGNCEQLERVLTVLCLTEMG